MNRLKGLYILDETSFPLIYGAEEREEISEMVEVVGPLQTRESIRANRAMLADAEVIISGWSAPVMNEEFLEAAPHLRAVFYGSGSVRYFTPQVFWEREIVITSAYAANAVPVAEYTLANILLGLKHFWRYSAEVKNGNGWGDHCRPILGGYGTSVGLVSCGMIARKTLELLAPFDMERLVYCPFLTQAEARELGVKRCTLAELFRKSDVVSVHTPLLPETLGLITGAHIASMKKDATFINTARGGVVRQQEMIDALSRRPDLTAVLDVCDPEPAPASSPLVSMPNVVLTPHIAGSHGREIRRMGRYMVDEIRRYVSGKPLKWQITRELAARLA